MTHRQRQQLQARILQHSVFNGLLQFLRRQRKKLQQAFIQRLQMHQRPRKPWSQRLRQHNIQVKLILLLNINLLSYSKVRFHHLSPEIVCNAQNALLLYTTYILYNNHVGVYRENFYITVGSNNSMILRWIIT